LLQEVLICITKLIDLKSLIAYISVWVWLDFT